MKWFKHLSMTLLLLLMTACAGDNLEKMIPADAIGVVSIDVTDIVKKAGMLDDGKFFLPQALRQAIDENDTSPFCIMLNDLPQMGLNTRSKAYVFFSTKTFGRVLLAALDEPDKARKTLEMRIGGEFAKVEDLDCMYVKDNIYVIDDGVLLIGTVNMPMEVAKAARAAKAILSKSATSITENKDVKELLGNDSEINVWLQGKGLKSVLAKSDACRDLAQKLPLVAIFTESDIDAVTCNVDFDEKAVLMNTRILADDNSDYAQVLNTTLGKPSADVLKAIPNSMDYIFTISVQGDRFVKLKQIQQLLEMFGKVPYIGRIDLASILSTIDGPFTIALARDPHLQGEWNMVFAARSSNPDGVVEQISKFAISVGQAPELYEGEYVYQYDNKMIRIGVTDGILYMKMLDYEQTEGYAYELQPVKDFFNGAVIGFFTQARTDSISRYFDFGFQDIYNGKGHFYTSSDKANASQEFLRSLCTIRVSDGFANEDDDISAFMSRSIDKLQDDE